MKKQNFSAIQEDINRVDMQGKKVLFLQNTVQELTANTLFAPGLQVDFIDHGLAEFFDEIALATKKVLQPILLKKHKQEELIYKNLLSK
jgi:hypothetical protein